jgi:sulfate adenylyltransferase
MPLPTDLAAPRLLPPYGGRLVDRILPPGEAAELRTRARGLPRVVLAPLELADLELIATGAASPLEGFLGRDDHDRVVADLRLADGTVWPLPLSLPVPDEAVPSIEAAGEAALCDATGRLWGAIRVTSLWRTDPRADAKQVFGTDDPAHPGVADLLSRPAWRAGGPVLALPLPEDRPFAARRLTPRDVRAEIARRGWRRVAGFQTRNPIHRAHERLTKLALEWADGLVIHPVVGETRGEDVPADVRFRTYDVLVERYYPKDRTLLAAFPAAMRWAGPREALFHALVRRNYGIGHLIVGRDHAGVGGWYEPTAAQRIFDRFLPEEIGVEPLRLEATFHCRACGDVASERTCPHDASSRLTLSGTHVREILRAGGALPAEFTRP